MEAAAPASAEHPSVVSRRETFLTRCPYNKGQCCKIHLRSIRSDPCVGHKQLLAPSVSPGRVRAWPRCELSPRALVLCRGWAVLSPCGLESSRSPQGWECTLSRVWVSVVCFISFLV